MTLEATASTLHEQTDRVAGIAHATADGLHATADYVRENDLQAMSKGIGALVRRYPAQSLVAAAVLPRRSGDPKANLMVMLRTFWLCAAALALVGMLARDATAGPITCIVGDDETMRVIATAPGESRTAFLGLICLDSAGPDGGGNFRSGTMSSGGRPGSRNFRGAAFLGGPGSSSVEYAAHHDATLSMTAVQTFGAFTGYSAVSLRLTMSGFSPAGPNSVVAIDAPAVASNGSAGRATPGLETAATTRNDAAGGSKNATSQSAPGIPDVGSALGPLDLTVLADLELGVSGAATAPSASDGLLGVTAVQAIGAQVPEPATLVLLGTGLFALAVRLRRKP